jgi:hypothetical protein
MDDSERAMIGAWAAEGRSDHWTAHERRVNRSMEAAVKRRFTVHKPATVPRRTSSWHDSITYAELKARHWRATA